MYKTSLFKSLAAVYLLSVGLPLIGSDNRGQQYAALEIEPFAVPETINLPQDFRDALQNNLVERLQGTKRFERVFLAGDSTRAAVSSPLRLTGSITRFKKGSRAERYFIGPGFGRTLIKAHIQVIDVPSGAVKLDKTVSGQVIIGLFGGDSKGATNGLAKDIAKAVKKL